MKGVTYELENMLILFNSQWFGLPRDQKIPDTFTKKQMNTLLKLETPIGTRSQIYKKAPFVMVCMTKGMDAFDIAKRLNVCHERARQLCQTSRDLYIEKWKYECKREKFPQFVYDVNLSERIYKFLSNYLVIRKDYPVDCIYKYTVEDLLKVPGIGPYFMDCIQQSLEKVGLPRITDYRDFQD